MRALDWGSAGALMFIIQESRVKGFNPWPAGGFPDQWDWRREAMKRRSDWPRQQAVDGVLGAAASLHHRDYTAGQHLDRITSWLWLMFRDDVFFVFENAPFGHFGVPKIRAAAWLLDIGDPCPD